MSLAGKVSSLQVVRPSEPFLGKITLRSSPHLPNSKAWERWCALQSRFGYQKREPPTQQKRSGLPPPRARRGHGRRRGRSGLQGLRL